MNALTTKYGTNGDFVVLGFPCNIFKYQEPGGNGTEILNGVKHVRPGNNFEPNFQMFEKIEVNGANEHPLYTYLKRNCPPTARSFTPSILFYSPIKSSDVAWNWETFLVGRDGKVIRRAAPFVDPMTLTVDIEMAMADGKDEVIG